MLKNSLLIKGIAYIFAFPTANTAQRSTALLVFLLPLSFCPQCQLPLWMPNLWCPPIWHRRRDVHREHEGGSQDLRPFPINVPLLFAPTSLSLGTFRNLAGPSRFSFCFVLQSRLRLAPFLPTFRPSFYIAVLLICLCWLSEHFFAFPFSLTHSFAQNTQGCCRHLFFFCVSHWF